jgi:DNA polymerase/3'-5' exonuclease PolX
MSESLQELVQDDADLTQYAGIGDAIAAAIREIVQTGSLRKLETLRAQASPLQRAACVGPADVAEPTSAFHAAV